MESVVVRKLQKKKKKGSYKKKLPPHRLWISVYFAVNNGLGHLSKILSCDVS